jgi:hypothetical protein
VKITCWRVPLLITAGALAGVDQRATGQTLLFEELFEDQDWASRGWYDGPQMQITDAEHVEGSGHSCVWHWEKAGDISPRGRGARVLLPPVDNVILSFYIKHSPNWKWTGVNWHPHEFHFLTNVDPPYIGPAYTHLTFYIEAVNGKPRVAIQDGRNIDAERIGQNLVGITEKRAVAGGNGDSDGYGNLGYYRQGDVYWNGKFWEPDRVFFSDEPGPYYKGDWHHVKVKLQLNSIRDGIGVRDGILQYWFDGRLIMDYHDVVFRTGQHPDMKINQFLMAPYYGPGVPHEQSIWIDDLRIYTEEKATPMAKSPEEIPLTLTNDLPFERRAEPVTCGVPLVRGWVRRAEELTLLGPEGQAVPVQILPTSTYHDGTPRWVLLDFQADLPAAGRAVYRLTKGPRVPPPLPLTARLEGGVAWIDTGVAEFRIDTQRFRLFDAVKVGGQDLLGEEDGGAFLEEGNGTRHRGDERTTQAEFEEAGPMKAVLAVRGQIRPGESLPLADYVCRLHFYAGRSEVRVFYTLHNPAAHNHPGNTWDLGSGGSVFMEDFSILLPLARGTWASRVGLAADQPPLTATRLYQDSSGGPHWDSVNHIDKDYRVPTTFRGYRVYEGPRQVAAGDRAEGWLHVRGEAGGVAVGVREFWQNFPKALEYRDNTLRIGLWPREFAGVHELLGGEQKTHEMLFVFHGASTPEEAIERRLKAFQRPLYALPDPPALYATRAFWPTAPLDRERFRLLEQTCDTFVEPVGGESVLTKWEQIDEFGWRHFGDTFADNEVAPEKMVQDFPEHHFGRQPISHFGNEYDVNYGVMLQGLRRGDPRWMWLADVMCRHYADICIYHTDADGAEAYRHGPFTHTTHETAAFRSTHRMYPREAEQYGLQYASGGPNAGHCYVASLAQHYYLTGDRVSREAFLEVADWTVHSPWFTQMMMGDPRGLGNFLMTHVYAYQLTQDPKYYDAALRMIDFVKEPFEGLGATLFVKAVGRFLDLKWENGEIDQDYQKALEKMLLFGDLYLTLPDDQPRRYLEQTCFYAEILFTCYLHAPPDHPRRERYFARGKALMDQAQERWPGRYCPTKTLIMCFGNTGAYFRALAEKE